jgi:hypothetical protein
MANVMRTMVSENDPAKMLRICAEDPMWADHAEVGKPLLLRAAADLDALRRYVSDADKLTEAFRIECDALRKDAELLAWVLEHPETAAECLEDAAAGDGTARGNLEFRRDALAGRVGAA